MRTWWRIIKCQLYVLFSIHWIQSLIRDCNILLARFKCEYKIMCIINVKQCTIDRHTVCNIEKVQGVHSHFSTYDMPSRLLKVEVCSLKKNTYLPLCYSIAVMLLSHVGSNPERTWRMDAQFLVCLEQRAVTVSHRLTPSSLLLQHSEAPGREGGGHSWLQLSEQAGETSCQSGSWVDPDNIVRTFGDGAMWGRDPWLDIYPIQTLLMDLWFYRFGQLIMHFMTIFKCGTICSPANVIAGL